MCFQRHLILFIHNFIFGLGLGLDVKKLASASALTSKLWPRSRPRPQGPGLGLGLGLEILASFNITVWNSHGQVIMATPDAAFSVVRLCSYTIHHTQYDRPSGRQLCFLF